MKRIVLCGCNGKMGRNIAACVKDRDDCTIVAGVDVSGEMLDAFPVFTSVHECAVKADVVIDFSHPNALLPLLDYAVSNQMPTVIATTGHTKEQIALIHERSKYAPLFFTANMSLGVNLIAELAKKAASILGTQFDIEIIEKHHNQKIDSPSGTALMLADEIASVMDIVPQYIYDRHAVRKKRGVGEIGIHAVRGGTIVGDHDIIFAGRDEVITISHSAASKEVFAVGAVNAALFMCGKGSGLYSMKDLV